MVGVNTIITFGFYQWKRVLASLTIMGLKCKLYLRVRHMCLNIPILGAFVFALVTLIPPARLLTAALREAAGHTNTFMPKCTQPAGAAAGGGGRADQLTRH
jgi:hypothetical protein